MICVERRIAMARRRLDVASPQRRRAHVSQLSLIFDFEDAHSRCVIEGDTRWEPTSMNPDRDRATALSPVDDGCHSATSDSEARLRTTSVRQTRSAAIGELGAIQRKRVEDCLSFSGIVSTHRF
jgi:hypothetical protein